MIVRFEQLWIGDRFMAYGNLWTYMGSGSARQHSQNSRQLGNDGYGYIGDVICSFEPDEEVEFVPPQK